MSFSTLFLVFTLTWITEKELEQVIQNKTCKFHSGSEKMRNASGQQGTASKVKMSGSEKIKANMNTENKIFGKDIRQFVHKNNV